MCPLPLFICWLELKNANFVLKEISNSLISKPWKLKVGNIFKLHGLRACRTPSLISIYGNRQSNQGYYQSYGSQR
jgi:hypothetical protein